MCQNKLLYYLVNANEFSDSDVNDTNVVSIIFTRKPIKQVEILVIKNNRNKILIKNTIGLILFNEHIGLIVCGFIILIFKLNATQGLLHVNIFFLERDIFFWICQF